MSVDEQVFELLNRCDCCRKPITVDDRAICVVKFPAGGSDTLCVDCYWATIHAAIAWYSYNGTLPSESTEERLRRARRLSNEQRARTILSGIVYPN